MKEKKYLVLGITLVVLTFVGVSLAYFLTTIEGERKNITINTSDLRVIFTNGDAIEGIEIEPGWSVTKTFSVENKSKNEYKYNIVIEDLVNTFKTTGYLQYKITSTDGGYNMTSFEDVPKTFGKINTTLAFNIDISKRTIHNYTITIQYPNDENIDQSLDGVNQAELNGNIYIQKSYSGGTLTEAIKHFNPTISERTTETFKGVFTSNINNTMYKVQENGTDVYYFSGIETNGISCKYNNQDVLFYDYDGYKIRSAYSEDECLSTNVCIMKDNDTNTETYYGGISKDLCLENENEWTNDKATYKENEPVKVNNWVKFGKYATRKVVYRGYDEENFKYSDYPSMQECNESSYNNNCTEKVLWDVGDDIYWRIIKTNDDGSIRLMYYSNNPNDNPEYVDKGCFYKDANGECKDGKVEYYKYSNSNVKTLLDSWYNSNLLVSKDENNNLYDSYVSTTAKYCNDINEYEKNDDHIFFGYANRFPQTDDDYLKPTYNCTGDSIITGAKIATITFDELAYAGGAVRVTSAKDYNASMWYGINNYGETSNNVSQAWTMTPCSLYFSDGMHIDEGMQIFYPNVPSVISFTTGLSDELLIKPVISLKSTVKWKSGNGTWQSPFEVSL